MLNIEEYKTSKKFWIRIQTRMTSKI